MMNRKRDILQFLFGSQVSIEWIDQQKIAFISLPKLTDTLLEKFGLLEWGLRDQIIGLIPKNHHIPQSLIRTELIKLWGGDAPKQNRSQAQGLTSQELQTRIQRLTEKDKKTDMIQKQKLIGLKRLGKGFTALLIQENENSSLSQFSTIALSRLKGNLIDPEAQQKFNHLFPPQPKQVNNWNSGLQGEEWGGFSFNEEIFLLCSLFNIRYLEVKSTYTFLGHQAV